MFDWAGMKETIEQEALKKAGALQELAYEASVRVVLDLPYTDSAQTFVNKLNARGYVIAKKADSSN